jgi:hypothetical protein
MLFFSYRLYYLGSVFFKSLRNIKVVKASNKAIKNTLKGLYLYAQARSKFC